MDIREYLDNYFKCCGEAVADLKAQSENIEKAVAVLFEAWEKNCLVCIFGNGGSASSSSHLAADLAKTINDVPGRRGIRALTPWDNIPHISAVVNDRPKENYFTAWLDTFWEKNCVAIGISVHGGSGTDHGGRWSQNLLKALQYVKDRGGKTIGFSGYDGGPMAKLVDIPIIIPVREESLGTPLVESFHVVTHHGMVFVLKQRIAEVLK